MSASLPSFKPAVAIRAASSPRKPDPDRPKTVSANWWAPLFGWPSDQSRVAATAAPDGGDRPEISYPEAQEARPRSKFAPGCFTEEKAKQLRRKTRESSTFHDAMYHSAIAARLASD